MRASTHLARVRCFWSDGDTEAWKRRKVLCFVQPGSQVLHDAQAYNSRTRPPPCTGDNSAGTANLGGSCPLLLGEKTRPGAQNPGWRRGQIGRAARRERGEMSVGA